MCHLTCIKSFDGMPLFSRTSPDSKSLNLPLISTLNSIFTYGDNYGFKIHSADSNNFKIVWKMFHSSLTLILVEQIHPIDEHVYFDKIEILFNALVFMYGLDDLIEINSIEKFKNEIKIAYNLVDAILNQSKFDLFGGYMTDCVDAFIFNEASLFQSVLDETSEAIKTSYACLMLNGRLIAASNAWNELNSAEKYLISLLTLTLNPSTSYDIPIYLPYKSPREALRLLIYTLTSNNVVLCFICSEKPTVDSVNPIVKKLWHPIYKSLVNLKQYLPRNLPENISIDANMMCFLLIDKKTKRCFTSFCPNDKKFNSKDESKKRYELLKYCYLNMTTNYFRKYFRGLSSLIADESDENPQLTNCPEAYTLIKDQKCYAINDQQHQFFAVYNQNIPTYALRGVTKTCLNVLINALEN